MSEPTKSDRTVWTLRVLFWVAGLLAGGLSYAAGQSLNFEVFSHAAHDFAVGSPLYPGMWPYYKYSPAFAMFFVPFAFAPRVVGTALWALVNFAMAFEGLRAVVPRAHLVRACLIAGLGVALSTDGDQSNLFVAGCTLWTLAAYEQQRPFKSAFFVGAAGAVKVFPAAAALLLFLFPKKGRSFLALAVAGVFYLLVPLFWLSPSNLIGQYKGWLTLLGNDYAFHGWSVMTTIRDYLGYDMPPRVGQLLGAVLVLSPAVVRRERWSDPRFRRILVAAWMTYSVIFNHRAEYCTFTIPALAFGVYATARPAKPWLLLLMLAAYLAVGPFFTRAEETMPSGGLFAFLSAHRNNHPLRVVPWAAVFVAMLVDLWKSPQKLDPIPPNDG